MSYSGTLDETVPGQGEFARLGAGRIRALTLAVKERLASIFVNPDADPLKFKLPVVAALTVDHVFPSPTDVPAGFGTTATEAVTPPAGVTIPDNSPVVVCWKDTDAGAVVSAYSLSGWYAAGNINARVHNPSGSLGSLAGKTLKMTVFYPV